MTRSRGPTAVGIDVGTSSLKAVRILVGDGRVAVRRSVTYDYVRSGEPTRKPERWVDAARRALADLGSRRPDAIGFTGQMHALVPISGGRPLRDALLWLDYQGASALDSYCASHPEISLLAHTGNIPLPDFTLAKWLYLSAKHPSLRSRVDALPAAKDFVRDAFLAEASRSTDVNEAAGTQWFDPFRRCWDEQIAQSAGIPGAVLGAVVEPTSVVGELRSDLYGAPVPAAACAGDQQAADRALGAHLPGAASLGLGTSGVLAATTELHALPPGWDGGFHLFPLDEHGTFHVIGTIPALSGSLQWAASLLDTSVNGLLKLAAVGRPGAIRFFPYLGGSGAPHPDSGRRAQVRGLGGSSTPADLARAVLDGIASEVACQVAEMRDCGVRLDQLILSGGLARLDLLAETIASRTDMPVRRSGVLEASAVGAALYALDALDAGQQFACDTDEIHVPRRRAVDPRWLDERSEILSVASSGPTA